MNELKQIVLSPDPRLSEECAPVEKIDDEVRARGEALGIEAFARIAEHGPRRAAGEGSA